MPASEKQPSEEESEAEEDQDHRRDHGGDQGHHREQFAARALRAHAESRLNRRRSRSAARQQSQRTSAFPCASSGGTFPPYSGVNSHGSKVRVSPTGQL